MNLKYAIERWRKRLRYVRVIQAGKTSEKTQVGSDGRVGWLGRVGNGENMLCLSLNMRYVETGWGANIVGARFCINRYKSIGIF